MITITPPNEVEFMEAETPPSSVSHARIRQAYLKLLSRAEKLKTDELASINVLIPAAISTVLGFVPKLMTLEDEFVHQLPRFRIANLTELKTTALALSFAHSAYVAMLSTPTDLAHLAADLMVSRETLNNDIRSMAKRHLIDDSFLAKQNGTTGYQNIASDILASTAVLRGVWHRIEGRTTISMGEIDDAETKAYAISRALGSREQTAATVSILAERRVRFYTLFITAYDQVRRAVTFLRWDEEDADEFAPSLYGNRASPKKSDGTEDGAAEGTTSGAISPTGSTTAPSPTAPTGAAGGVTTAPTGIAPTTGSTKPTNTTTSSNTGTSAAASPTASGNASTTSSGGAAAQVLTTTASLNGGTLSVETSAAPGMPGHDPFGRT